MADQVIVCPHCHKKIPLTDAITQQLRAELEKDFTAQYEEREKVLRDTLVKEAKRKAKEEITVELKGLQEQIVEKDEKLVEMQKAELALRKRERKLEDEKKTMELEVARKLDEERDKIRQQAVTDAEEKSKLSKAEYEKRIKDLLDQVDILKRKGEQGSQQLQG